MQQRFNKKQREHGNGDKILDNADDPLEKLYEKALNGRTQYSALVGNKRVVVAVQFIFKFEVVSRNRLGLHVDFYFFLIEIDKTKVEIHIKRKILIARLPKEQIEPVNIAAREITLSSCMYYV